MSNPESFIDEVTEEVRRDKLFALFRKYAWIAVLVILAVVGTTAWREWQKARAQAAAQAFGDGLLAALDAGTPEARAEAIDAVPAAADQAAIRALMRASDPEADRAGSIAALEALVADPAPAQIYRDIATLRLVALQTDRPVADRRAALDPLAAPGRPFRPLALEQMAYLDVEAGDVAAAVARLKALTEDQEAPQGLRRRAAQMITALGAAP